MDFLEAEEWARVADTAPALLPIEDPAAPLSFEQFRAQDAANMRHKRRRTASHRCPFRDLALSLPPPRAAALGSATQFLHAAIAEQAADVARHSGLRGVFEGCATNAHQVVATCDRICLESSAFYIGATVRSLQDRWSDPDHGHCRNWHRMYGLCRCSDARQLVGLERALIARYRTASEVGGVRGPRCANVGPGGEHLPLSTPELYIGWLYVVVRDRH